MNNETARTRDITETVYLEAILLMAGMTAAFVIVLDVF